MVTIKDIARYVKLDVSTVSYVLSGNTKRASEQTRQRIFDAAEKLNYRPNLLARGLIKKKSSMIGLLIIDFGNPYFTEMVKGIHDTCEENNIKLIIGYPSETLESEIEHLQSLMDRQVEGIIFFPVNKYQDSNEQLLVRHRDCLQEIIDQGISLYCFGTTLRDFPNINTITYDFYSGTLMLMDYLITLGHRKIGFITPPYDPAVTNERLEAYKAALNKHGIEFDQRLVIACRNARQSAYDAAQELLKANPRITALFVYNDYMAGGAMKGVKDLGLRVPEDISMVGFDDIEEVSYLDPPLTTIWLQKYELGRILITNILKEMRDGPPQERVRISLEPNLVIRQSCCKPKTVPATSVRPRKTVKRGG